jgi:hypothetical protein
MMHYCQLCTACRPAVVDCSEGQACLKGAVSQHADVPCTRMCVLGKHANLTAALLLLRTSLGTAW